MDFIKKLLTQISTWQGVIKMVSASGLLTIAPDIANDLAQHIVNIITAVLYIAGAIDIIRNEKKKAPASTISQKGGAFLIPLLAVLCTGLLGSGVVKQEGKGLKIDLEVVKNGKPVDYGTLND